MNTFTIIKQKFRNWARAQHLTKKSNVSLLFFERLHTSSKLNLILFYYLQLLIRIKIYLVSKLLSKSNSINVLYIC